MEMLSKTDMRVMAAAAIVAIVVTWILAHAFVQSTAVARWVDAAQVAGQVVASTGGSGGGAVKSTAGALLK